MAPKGPQMHVVDHSTGQPVEGEDRDMFQEAARIARGKLRDLATVKADELDALVMPGGFGAAKNLSNFATKGDAAKPHPEVARLLEEMKAAGKPIGALCIAPAVLACALGREYHPELTIGKDAGTAKALESMGAHHETCEVTGFHVDETNRIVTTPAYMYDARIGEVSEGIEKLVRTVVEMTRTTVDK